MINLLLMAKQKYWRGDVVCVNLPLVDIKANSLYSFANETYLQAEHLFLSVHGNVLNCYAQCLTALHCTVLSVQQSSV